MSRETCYRCFWPKTLCWCGSIEPMPTRTRFVFLMHPKEFKREKAATGRLTHLCLPESEIHMGIGFDDHAAVQALIRDPQFYPVLVYPGNDAVNLSQSTIDPAALGGGRRLLVFLLDSTWSGSKKMLRLSPSLQRLPRVMFTPTSLSRFVIKQQPYDWCLSTLEATHELLLVLERAGLDTYTRPAQLLDLFARMQEVQIRFAADTSKPGYRRRAYRTPEVRMAARVRKDSPAGATPPADAR